MKRWFGKPAPAGCFACCGRMAAQLEKDVRQMGVPEDFLRAPYVLPMSFGWRDGRYFAADLEDRGNGWITRFDGSDGEEFRRFLLEEVAGRYAGETERRDRPEGESADFRIVWFTRTIRLLMRVYPADDAWLQNYVAQRESLLNLHSDSRLVWNAQKLAFEDEAAAGKHKAFLYCDVDARRYPIWLEGSTVVTDPMWDTAGGNVPFIRSREYPLPKESVRYGGISRGALAEFLRSIGEAAPADELPVWIPLA